MRLQSFLITAALMALAAPLTACASQPSDYSNAGFTAGYGAQASGEARYEQASYGHTSTVEGLLSEPPANAHAGECYAKVTVPGQPVYGPPAGPHLKWVQNPPQPGTIGPVWCQVWEQGYQPTVSMTPERYGWIRVICDKDATREKIGHIQHRLHDYGDYQGGYEGQYDASTAAAVTRFQREHHIEHGGYLSYQTMTALEAAPPPVPQFAAASSYAQVQSYGYSMGYASGQGYNYAPQPCAGPCQPPVVQLPCPGPCAGQGGYGQPGNGGQGGRRWMNWAGKTGF